MNLPNLFKIIQNSSFYKKTLNFNKNNRIINFDYDYNF